MPMLIAQLEYLIASLDAEILAEKRWLDGWDPAMVAIVCNCNHMDLKC